MKKVVLAALLAVSSPVFAQGYVGLGFGQASADLSEVGPINGVYPSLDENDTSFTIFGGAIFNPNFGAEVGYVDFGEMSATWDGLGSTGVDFVKSAAEASAFYAAVLGMLPLNEQASLFVKAGFARWDIDVLATSSFGGTASTSDSGTDPMFGVGVQFTVNNLLLRAEFERFNEIEVDVLGLSAAVKF